MKKKYKVLMLDLDGTTIPNRRDALPSQKVVEAIMKAHKNIFVCVATGRTLERAKPILDALKIKNPTILLGGSQIINGNSREFIFEMKIEDEDARTALKILEPYGYEIKIDKREKYFDYTSSYKPKNVFNILIKHLTEDQSNKLIKELSNIKTITAHKIISWKDGYIDVNVSHLLATKQHAILEVANILRIETHEIIGVGDGYNDFPLLMACGLKVAMGNAVPELKAIADYIAPTVENDGVADIIEKFIL